MKKSATIYFDDLDIDLKEDDYVKIDGVVLGDDEVSELNMTDVNIEASKVTKSDYIDVCSPTLKKYKINKTINQKGYKVTLQKVEFAKNETRVYIKIENDGKAEFSLHDYSSILIQGRKQYEPDRNFNADYPEIQDSIDKGVKTKGVIAFPKIKDNKNFTLKMEAYSDDFSEKINDYIFNVNIH